ncbi:hypothetical protein HPB51_001643 [Rhipicephalus microplus]|uniref:Uncharacterized protein n=1 Tax=Rhipicephalus microplus TaxID=6941 RepID=A0A9J6EVU4_RHIMP|nr:hypothetical protein HPB51_001643 [Rhipicephalus microplus]
MPSSQQSSRRERRKSTKRAPRRPHPTTSAPPKSSKRASRRPVPTPSATPLVPKTPRRSVATWARQEGQEMPRYFASDAPWKAQQRIRRDLPLDCVPWPFRSCTLANIEKAAGDAQLPTESAVEFCATCHVTVHYQCHYKGAMHVARTKAAAKGMATTGKASEPAPLSQCTDTDLAALCRQQMGEDPHFAALLSGLPPPATSDGPPTDNVATMDVDRLLELWGHTEPSPPPPPVTLQQANISFFFISQVCWLWFFSRSCRARLRLAVAHCVFACMGDDRLLLQTSI